MANPPSIGPSTRERLNCAEFSAIALVRSLRGTSAGTSAWCAGIAKDMATPVRNVSTATCFTVMTLANVSPASRKANTIIAAWLRISMVRRLTRSAMTPPQSANTSIGTCEAKPTIPSQKAEFVSWNTSQPMATLCIQVPTFDKKFPAQKNR
jgi:hypothetical protein